MKIILSAILLAAILGVSPVFAIPNLSNTEIIAESESFEDIVLVLEFGENKIDRNGKWTPQLDSGFLSFGIDIFEIFDARVKQMGNSFVIHSDSFLIYSHNVGSDNYNINVYLLGTNEFNPIKLSSTEIESQRGTTQNDTSELIQNIPLLLLVEQGRTVTVENTYNITTKVYDATSNSFKDINQKGGEIQGVEINIAITDKNGNAINQFTGLTNEKGLFEASHYLPFNALPGLYHVIVEAKYGSFVEVYETDFSVFEEATDGSNP